MTHIKALKLTAIASILWLTPSAFAAEMQLPHYDELTRLPTAKRARYLKAFQSALVELDRESGKDTPQTSQWLFNQLIRAAQADGDDENYCINQGVVKPIEKCDKSLGPKMHDFDTNEVLSELGPAAQCKNKSEKPCSPVFGFDSEGKLFCTDTNRTRVCQDKSKGSGTLSFADVSIACQLGSPGKAQVDCDKLKKFYNAQVDLLQSHCTEAPGRKACAILREQVKDISSEIADKNEALKSTGTQQVAQLVGTVNQLNKGISTAGPKVPCPDTAPAPATTCTDKTLGASTSKDAPVFENIFKALDTEDGKSQCEQISLAEGLIKFQSDGKTDDFSFLPKGSSKPIALNDDDILVLAFTSHLFLRDPFKVQPNDLLNAYLPVQGKEDAGKVHPNEKDPKKEYQTRGWVTADGTEVRYVPDVAFGSKDKPVMMVGVKPKNSTKEQLYAVPIPPDEVAH